MKTRFAESEAGELSVLNCGAGDIKVAFDKNNPLETERAKRIIQDMLKRGYALFVEVDGKLQKVRKFDAKRCEYLIADGPMVAAPEQEQADDESPRPNPLKRGRPKLKSVPMRTSRATGVAPTSGG
jgi:hypothetical protein